MMTPEKTPADEESGTLTPFVVNEEGTPFVNGNLLGGEATNDEAESEEEDLDEEPTETMQDEPIDGDDEEAPIEDMPLMGDGPIADINNTLNTSVSSENCRIINESDQNHTPCPDPEGTTVLMTGIMDGDEVVPNAANLTPVKLDPGLKEQQDAFNASPSNSTERMNDSTEEEEIQPVTISRRQQNMRIVKCYGAVAVIVLIFAIGIPLGAVMIFRNNSTETSFAGQSGSNNSPSTPSTTVDNESIQGMQPLEPPLIETEEEEIEVTEASQEESQVPEVVSVEFFDDEEQEMEDQIEHQDDEDGTTDPPLFFDEAETESPFFVGDLDNDPSRPVFPATDPPFIPTNTTHPFVEKNVTSMPNEAIDEFFNTDAPMTDAPDEVVVTDMPTEAQSAAPTSTPSVTPTTATPTATPSATPSLRATMPPGPDRTGIYFDLVNITSPAVLQDTTSPQALSYLWMVEKDQLLPVPQGRYLLQRYILVVLDHVLHDPQRPTLSNPNADHCLWEGVVCELETGDVKEINWRLQGLNGRLVEELQYLDSLERLDLSENELVGNLDQLYGATSLKHVYLHDNKFSGPLTEQVGQMEGLVSLYLGHNELTGQLPLSLRSPRGEAKPLKWLILSHNKFSGYLPPDWRLRNLFHLDLGHNMLKGPLPNDWDVNMVRLRHLYLDHNQFTGLLPAYFGQLGNGRLKQLHLNDNQLEGKVPENWDPLDQMTNIRVHHNKLTVPVHRRVCEMSVFEQGVLVELKTDCSICTCDFLCEFCVPDEEE